MLVEDPVNCVDNLTMAHAPEARTPFLAHELVELAAACPAADGGANLDGSSLWQLGLLELWLQRHVG